MVATRSNRVLPAIFALCLLGAGCGSSSATPADEDGGVPDDASPSDTPDATSAPDAAMEPLHDPMSVENVRSGDDWNAATGAALTALDGMYDPLTGTFSSGYMWSWASGIEVNLTGYELTGGAQHQFAA